MSDTSLQSETTPDEADNEASAEAVEADVVAEAEAVVTEAAGDEEVEELVDVIGEPAPAPKAKASKKGAAKKPTTAQAVDALVTTITSMAESVSTLSNTVDALSAKVATPPPAVIIEAPVAIEEVITEELVAEEPVAEKPSTLGKVALHSLGSLATFVAVGLVAAAAMRPHFDNVAIIMAPIGIMLFLLNAVFVDRDEDAVGIKSLVLHGVMSVLAVAATGLLVGGIQRFGDEPHRAAILVPLGAALFLVFSAYKMRTRLEPQHLVWMAGAGVWICLFLAVGLHAVANNVEPQPAKPRVSTPAAMPAQMPATTMTVAPTADEHTPETAKPTTETSLLTVSHEDHGILVIGSGDSTPTTMAESTPADSTPTTADPHQAAIDEAVKAGDEAASKSAH